MYGAAYGQKYSLYCNGVRIAGYSKQVFDEYGVLLLWDENGINQGIENYIRKIVVRYREWIFRIF